MAWSGSDSSSTAGLLRSRKELDWRRRGRLDVGVLRRRRRRFFFDPLVSPRSKRRARPGASCRLGLRSPHGYTFTPQRLAPQAVRGVVERLAALCFVARWFNPMSSTSIAPELSCTPCTESGRRRNKISFADPVSCVHGERRALSSLDYARNATAVHSYAKPPPFSWRV